MVIFVQEETGIAGHRL